MSLEIKNKISMVGCITLSVLINGAVLASGFEDIVPTPDTEQATDTEAYVSDICDDHSVMCMKKQRELLKLLKEYKEHKGIE